MSLFRRLVATPKRLCDSARKREFERQLRAMQEKWDAEQVQQFEAFRREMDEKWREMNEALTKG